MNTGHSRAEESVQISLVYFGRILYTAVKFRYNFVARRPFPPKFSSTVRERQREFDISSPKRRIRAAQPEHRAKLGGGRSLGEVAETFDSSRGDLRIALRARGSKKNGKARGSFLSGRPRNSAAFLEEARIKLLRDAQVHPRWQANAFPVSRRCPSRNVKLTLPRGEFKVQRMM